MPAPSKPFTIIAPSRIDPDSPVDTTLMVDLAENDVHLEEWLGFGFTAAQAHTHNGTDSAKIGAMIFVGSGSGLTFTTAAKTDTRVLIDGSAAGARTHTTADVHDYEDGVFSVIVDLDAFTMNGYARINEWALNDVTGGVTANTSTTLTHTATALPDDSFVNLVAGGTLVVMRIKFNRTTDVFTIELNAGFGTITARYVEFTK